MLNENAHEYQPTLNCSVNSRQLKMHRAGWKVFPAMIDVDAFIQPYLLFVAVTPEYNIFKVCRVFAKTPAQAACIFESFKADKAKTDSTPLGKIFITMQQTTGLFFFNDDPFGVYKNNEMTVSEDTSVTVNVTFTGDKVSYNHQSFTPAFNITILGKMKKDLKKSKDEELYIPGVDCQDINSDELRLYLVERKLIDIQEHLTTLIGKIPDILEKLNGDNTSITTRVQKLINMSLKLKNTLETAKTK